MFPQAWWKKESPDRLNGGIIKNEMLRITNQRLEAHIAKSQVSRNREVGA